MQDLSNAVAGLNDKSLLVLDDDAPFRNRLGRALEARGFEPVQLASSIDEAMDDHQDRAARLRRARHAARGRQRPQVVEAIQTARPDARVIMLTGYGAIATAVAAVKAGAVDYLSKPADADDVVRALLARQSEAPAPPENPMSADRVRWEHIQRVYELCNHNVSETARRLNMHRRTLQRILAKRAPR